MEEEYQLQRKQEAQRLLDESEAAKQFEQNRSTLEPAEEQQLNVQAQQENNAPLKTPEALTPQSVPQPQVQPESVPQQEEKSALNKSIFATTPLAIPSAMGLGVLDFGIDVATKLTGQEQLDDKWDRATKFDNPWAQRLRNFSSVAIPTFEFLNNFG